MITKDLHGIIFNQFNYKESDLIVDVLTKEYGFIQLYVKGGQKTSSKSFFIFKLFNVINFDVSKLDLTNLSIYKSGSIQNVFDYTKLDYNEMNSVMFISELLLKVKNTMDFNIEYYYDKMLMIINDISVEKKYSTYFNINYFIYITLQILGCAPILDSCVECSKNNGIVVYSYDKHGFICKDCHSVEDDCSADKEFLTYLYELNNYKELENNIIMHKKVFEMFINILADNTGVFLISQKYIY